MSVATAQCLVPRVPQRKWKTCLTEEILATTGTTACPNVCVSACVCVVRRIEEIGGEAKRERQRETKGDGWGEKREGQPFGFFNSGWFPRVEKKITLEWNMGYTKSNLHLREFVSAIPNATKWRSGATNYSFVVFIYVVYWMNPWWIWRALTCYLCFPPKKTNFSGWWESKITQFTEENLPAVRSTSGENEEELRVKKRQIWAHKKAANKLLSSMLHFKQITAPHMPEWHRWRPAERLDGRTTAICCDPRVWHPLSPVPEAQRCPPGNVPASPNTARLGMVYFHIYNKYNPSIFIYLPLQKMWRPAGRKAQANPLSWQIGSLHSRSPNNQDARRASKRIPQLSERYSSR